MIFPAINLHVWVIFHGYVSHNQMVPYLCMSISSGFIAWTAEVYEGGWQTGKRHGKATFTTWLTQKITWTVVVIKQYV